MHPYLTTEETAQLLSRTRRSVVRDVEQYRLPALRIGRTVRIEARAIAEDAPPSWPAWTGPVTSEQLAELWRVSRESIRRLVRAGELRGRMVATAQGHLYTFSPRDVARYVADHSTGPDEGTVATRLAS